MNNKTTEKIRIWGIVQGVGFRPFIAKLAANSGMKGFVLNTGGLVEITVTDSSERIDAFVDAISRQAPSPAEIVHIKRSLMAYREFDGFSISSSAAGDNEAAMIPADIAVCPSCLRELYDVNNKRYRHPFISCMACGPRYTILDRFPYDRDNTSMIDYPMCPECNDEYTSIKDRRYHAQTISCHSCGPQLIWDDLHGQVINGGRDTNELILDAAASIIKSGGIIAFKSVGGYNLVADPFNREAVTALRAIKHRESKPFAVMFRDIDQTRRFCEVNDVEEKLLKSSARPIILLEHRLEQLDLDYKDDLLQSRYIGSFLPSLAAQYMLLDRTGPLIFTSANPSGLPMIKDDREIRCFAGHIGGILYNERRIHRRMDDSVARVIDSQPQMIRRSKGYAPVPLHVNCGSAAGELPSIFAAGSQLKNSFALSKGPFVYVSQFFGDMDTLENQDIYSSSLNGMKELFRIEPEAVACDMHPLYFSTEFAKKYAGASLPLIQVQHHHAHVASVMAENNISGPLLGVCFDGTGYGTDGNIWGGEFLLCEGGYMERFSHLRYMQMIGGDASMKDGVRSALSYITAYGRASDQTSTKKASGSPDIPVDISDILEYGADRILSSPKTPIIKSALDNSINVIKSSSMGRLFDAVSALLGICDYNSYEGKSAILLEDAAAFALKHPGTDSARLGPARACELALSFHDRIIDMIVSQCLSCRDQNPSLRQVALTGGTFQNRILMEGALQKLRGLGFEPYYNISVSPNDGGIALGQTYVAMQRLLSEKNR